MEVEKKYVCGYCNHQFTQRNNMYSHMKYRCKIKKKNEDDKQNIYNELLELKKINENLEQRIKQLEFEKKSVNIKSNNVNSFNNIILVGYGNENLKKIDRADILKSIKSGFNSSLVLTDTIHFNPKYPEYHNVYISNIRDKYGMMYDGKDWALLTKTDLVDKIYDEKKNFIESKLDDFYDSMTKSQKNALERWMDINEEHPKIKKIKESIKLLLYNKRNMPLKMRETQQNTAIE